MIINNKVITKWNSRTKKYYEELGYVYTFMGDDLEVNVFDLPNRSMVKVEIECDYCHKSFLVSWYHRTKSLEDTIIKKDVCYDCKYLKAKEAVQIKYGVDNITKVEEFKRKQEETCYERYGVINPFQSEVVKDKIIAFNLNKYGETSFTKTSEYLQKRRETCLQRYGVDSHMKLPKYKEMFTGKKSPVWKGGIHDERWDRLQPKYKQWRKEVFIKDSFTCRKCGITGGKLEAHHVYNWNDYVGLRYNTDNGITFCINCHIEFHQIYGKYKNDKFQLDLFLQ